MSDIKVIIKEEVIKANINESINSPVFSVNGDTGHVLIELGSASVIDNLITQNALIALSANQGFILKGFIDNINTLLTSDETSLDNLQEIVDFINLNRTTLDALGITNISGLENALNSKVDIISLSTVATSGEYSDLLNIPPTEIPNHGTLTGLENDDHIQYALADGQRGAFASLAQGDLADTSVQRSEIVDDLISNDVAQPLSANQGLILKGFIDNINTLLTSDETNLDTLQEIVDFIELNKATLDTLGIANIAGLENALDLKQDLREIKTISTDTYILLETDNNKKLQFTNALGCTITIPTGLTLGNSYEGKQMEAGQLTFTNAVGVTLNKSATDTLKTADQYSVFGLDCTSTNKYVLFGKLELV